MKEKNRPVLIVDDDADWRESLSQILGHHFPVRTASSSKEALALARQVRPAVILLDVMMPGDMDGFRLFAELAKKPETRSIPVIFLSAVNAVSGLAFTPETIGQQLGATPAAFLEKSLAVEPLMAEIRRVLRGQRSA